MVRSPLCKLNGKIVEWLLIDTYAAPAYLVGVELLAMNSQVSLNRNAQM